MELIDITQIIAAILVICEAVKRAGLKSEYVPLLSIALGVAGAFVFGGLDWANTLLGIIVGLGTTLLYREVNAAVNAVG